MNVQFRPLERWPHKKTVNRSYGRFRANYPNTIELLESELGKLGATDVVISGGFQRKDARRDGWPSSEAKALYSVPGIVLTFRTPRLGNQEYVNDEFYDWKDNLRGIALTLEALRAIRRYGTVQQDQQYRGFGNQLVASVTSRPPSRVDAARWLSEISEAGEDAADILGDPEARERAYRAAARDLHPDRPTGDADKFVRLQQVIEILRGEK